MDLRSDTVTRPTPEMYKAMVNAPVGDDVWGDDSTVTRLEDELSTMFGMECGLFVPSGTMSNLIAVMSHCDSRTSEAILGDKCHIHVYEAGGIASIAGVHSKVLHNNDDGTLDLEEVAQAIRPDNVHFPETQLICIENTHNLCGGRVLPTGYMQQLSSLAKKHKVKLHLDGARIFNALEYSGETPRDMGAVSDSISVCLSKGLGAPAGSVLLGDKDFIEKGRRYRKLLGGGMRQAGVLAGAGLYALEHIVPLLKEDHRRTTEFVGLLNEHFRSVGEIQTNMAMIEFLQGDVTAECIEYMKTKHGVLLAAKSSSVIRFVFHHQIGDEDVKNLATWLNAWASLRN